MVNSHTSHLNELKTAPSASLFNLLCEVVNSLIVIFLMMTKICIIMVYKRTFLAIKFSW